MGVRPLVIDLEMVPGETREFEITLTPSEKDEIVNLSFYKPVQLNTGNLTFYKADAEAYPVVDWVKLETERIELPAEENGVVRGSVTAPFTAEGTHTVVVMIEPEVEEAAQGVTFQVRYAVRLNIIINRPGIRPSGKIIDFEFNTENKELPVINTVFKNDSRVYYDAIGEAVVRNEQGRLVQRIEMRTPAAWQSDRDFTTIYPDSEVLFTGNITEPLYPGKYQLRLFFRYANGMQIIERKDLFLEESFGTIQGSKPIRIQPEIISLELRPGAASSQVIEVENLSEEELSILVSGRDLERDYPYSIFSQLEVQLRGEQEMLIPPYGKKRIVLTIRAPKELNSGGYYGYLDFVEHISGEKEEIYSVLLENVTAKGELEPELDVISFYCNSQGEEGLFSVEIKNEGRVHLAPEGELILRDQAGNILKKLELRLPEGIEKLYPGRSLLLTAEWEQLQSGSYQAEIGIFESGKKISNKLYEFKLE